MQAKTAPPARTAAQFVYVATSNGTIRQFAARPDGSLAPSSTPSVRVASSDFPVTLVLHPTHPFAYAATINDQSRKATIYPYRVLSNGTLAPIRAAAWHLRGVVGYLLADPKGRFLYAVGENGNVFTFRCLPDGNLAFLFTNHISGTFGMGLLVGQRDEGLLSADPTGRFVFAYSASGFVDHSESSLTTYRVLSSGVFKQVAGHQDKEHVDVVDFDGAGKWAFMNPDNRNFLLLRVQTNGSLSVVHKQAIQNGHFVVEVTNEKGIPHSQTVPSFARLLFLNTKQQIAILSGQNDLAFAHVSSAGQLTVISHFVLPRGLPLSYEKSDAAFDRNGRFLYLQFVKTQRTAQGGMNLPPELLVINVGDATHAPKIIQTLPLGGDFLETIVMGRAIH